MKSIMVTPELKGQPRVWVVNRDYWDSLGNVALDFPGVATFYLTTYETIQLGLQLAAAVTDLGDPPVTTP